MKPKNELSSLHLRTLIALHRLVPDFFANIFEYGSGPFSFSVSSRYVNFERLGQTFRTSECFKLDLRD